MSPGGTLNDENAAILLYDDQYARVVGSQVKRSPGYELPGNSSGSRSLAGMGTGAAVTGRPVASPASPA